MTEGRGQRAGDGRQMTEDRGKEKNLKCSKFNFGHWRAGVDWGSRALRI